MQANWFVGLPFPRESLPGDELALLPEGTRAFDPEDLHVTLAFLGAIGERSALRAWERFEPHDAALPLCTTLQRRAVFGAPHRPSALGLDLDPAGGDAPLTRLIAEWRNLLRSTAGLEPEQRPVRPHVTLGRPPRRTGTDWREALSAWLDRPLPQASVRLERIALYTRAEAGSRRRFREVRVFPSA